MDALTPSQQRAADFILSARGNAVIDGPPGHGKSFLLRFLQEELQRRGVRYATIAPRGGCAFIVEGDTVHSKLLPLPRRQPFFRTNAALHDALRMALSGKLAEPLSTRGKMRSEFWKNLDLLFIDEVFLMDAGLLAMTDLTARVERGCAETSFGGIRLVFMGDPCQMGPRSADVFHPFRPLPLMDPEPNQQDQDEDTGERGPWDLYGNVSLKVQVLAPWKDAKLTYNELTENMRQAEQVFRSILAWQRRGAPIKDMDPALLTPFLNRCVDVAPDDALVLYWSREDVARRNREMNERLGGGEVRVILSVMRRTDTGAPFSTLQDTDEGRELAKLVDEFVHQLPMEGELYIRENTRVMLESNVDIKAGAYRGSTGVVQEVARDPSGQVSSITVLLESTNQNYVVKPAEEKIECEGRTCRVIYFPLSYGYAKTYDGIQGATIKGKLACAITPRMPRGMFYVGISRVTTLENLYIIPNVNRFNAISDARAILLEYPNITKNDPMVERFLADRARRKERVEKDQAVFDSINRSGNPVHAVCVLCGGAAEVLMRPCAHLAACRACWTDCEREGAVTCPACSVLVNATEAIQTFQVCRRDML